MFFILGGSSTYGGDAQNIDNLLSPGVYKCTTVTQGTKPFNYPTVVVWRRVVSGSNDTVHQMAFDADGIQALAVRMYSVGSSTWSEWKMITFDMPTFYKNYSTFNDLTNAIGNLFEIEKVVGYGAFDSIDVSKLGVYIIVDLYYYSTVGVYLRKGTSQQGSPNPVSFEKIFGDDFAGTLSGNTYTFTRRIQAGKVIRIGGATE